MKKMFTSCLLAASAAMMGGCHGNEPTSPAAVQTAQARVVESQQQQVPLNVRATGTIHARETAVVSAQVVGRIQQVLVREGDSVRAGQTLVVLDDAALRASAEQAQAGVKAAQDEQAAAQTDAKLAASTLDRYRQLQAEKSVSPQEMDEVAQRAEASAARLEAVRAQTDAARAQESGAHTMLGYSRLVAPFAGVVTARMADPGTLASPGVPLLQVDQAGALQLEATVDESAISAIHKGMKAQVAIDGGNFHEPRGHRRRDRPSRRSCQSQLSGEDRSAAVEPTARRHVWNCGVCQRRPPGDCHSALRCCHARLSGMCVCSRRPGNCAAPFPHVRRDTRRPH